MIWCEPKPSLWSVRVFAQFIATHWTLFFKYFAIGTNTLLCNKIMSMCQWMRRIAWAVFDGWICLVYLFTAGAKLSMCGIALRIYSIPDTEMRKMCAHVCLELTHLHIAWMHVHVRCICRYMCICILSNHDMPATTLFNTHTKKSRDEERETPQWHKAVG